MTPPENPNPLALNFQLWKFYGDPLELEHDHVLLGQAGAVRILGYRNHEDIGRFADAIAAFQADPNMNAAACGTSYNYYTANNYSSGNVTAPDLCWVRKRKPNWASASTSSSTSPTTSACSSAACTPTDRPRSTRSTPADRSLSFGAVAKGSSWHRPFDVTGVGFGSSWISGIHAQYLAMGGVDGFVGDGHLRQAAEEVVDAFYSLNFLKAIWLTADYQHIWNPGFNADRGPVNILGGRVHAEF